MGCSRITQKLFFTVLEWAVLIATIVSIILITTSVISFVLIPPMGKTDMETVTTDIIRNGTQQVVNVINQHTSSHSKPVKSSFVLSNLPPVKFQGKRSTCWAFSTIFQLEYAYNKDLSNKYISLNEQAYAIDAVEACKADDYKGCPKKRFDYSTNTGYPQFLWRYSSLSNKVLPESICEYQTNKDNEWKCDGKEQAQKTNALKFDVKSIATFRTIEELKEAVKQGPVSLVLVLVQGQYIIQVDNKDNILGKIPGAEIKECPENSNLCVYIPSERITNDGEYIIPERANNRYGYHVVTIVGYNDNYITKDNTRGAFIIRDSTDDTLVYGSHSYQYLKGEHSEWDERTLCANVYNPLGWDSCVFMNPGPTGDSKVVKYDLKATCLNEKYIKENVLNTRKPTEFKCINSDFCDTTKRYFISSTSRSQHSSYLFTITFLEVNPNNTDEQKEITFTDFPLDSYNKFIQPIDSQIELIQTNTTFCGYRSLPYIVLDKISMAKTQDSYYGVQFNIEWDKQSYPNNGEFDYSQILKSIHEFPEYKGFLGPEPYQVRYED
ncbi:hypothetical protein ENUP19_0266G0032 [Entamoeba nuttalli]|uniref:Peptidase C1A papain C-terminal domain-containing protein n=2 Tax=Entamoeba nuttalli TaxID=412467 RepID=K2GFE4_ENTNP|nr:hypothetical protein ENU1_057430 [Entamoeba nuttalli P19]EKE41391.1 hypothetical protein ENU1_057430 [Entamoeba nuttalli P19]|eukprot:XP_008856276.1 hypothetical protein ENU1_057430 [Entamoeba nuttalli P19]